MFGERQFPHAGTTVFFKCSKLPGRHYLQPVEPQLEVVITIAIGTRLPLFLVYAIVDGTARNAETCSNLIDGLRSFFIRLADRGPINCLQFFTRRCAAQSNPDPLTACYCCNRSGPLVPISWSVPFIAQTP